MTYTLLRLQARNQQRLIFAFAAFALAAFAFAAFPSAAFAHGVAGGDQAFMMGAQGAHPFAFAYLGAKHMVTGYDHLAYLAGVIFFLTKIKDVFKFVSLFAIGHSITLLFGVLAGIDVNPYVVDAIIGLSVCYKALENLDVIHSRFGVALNPKMAVFGFGLVHGFGLSSKLQDFNLSEDGLIANMLSFNVGVEIGQIIGLTFLLGLFYWLRSLKNFAQISVGVNMLLFMIGLVLFGMQCAGIFVGA